MATSSGWKGDRKFLTLDSERVLNLKANKRKSTSFTQTIDSRDIKDLTLKFRYKSFNYKGRGLQTRGERGNGGSTYRNHSLKSDGEWHEISWRFSEIRGSRRINFSFLLLEGEGEVFFNDISVETVEIK